MESGSWKLEGVKTKEDADKVLQALNSVWGVRKAEVNLNSGEAIVSFDEKAATYDDFAQAVIDSGYKVGGSKDEGL
ncbi:heavy-metal-associated domain-containing protein [Robertmurraya kyonggiensis]|uniref:Heavy-metal-associated domain-containing protein n=1 Tax=Robertmurraya kyonggiensis TaxID=1037680 RepID=A0A4U1D8Y4_9BACI|nr:heavy-metal-associated domain-containing protein [Robertmurraya kyonggiensis]TKC18962.1 heavy-metal-associated domain-containing protein [Robertmurraya kyonggiensis]